MKLSSRVYLHTKWQTGIEQCRMRWYCSFVDTPNDNLFEPALVFSTMSYNFDF